MPLRKLRIGNHRLAEFKFFFFFLFLDCPSSLLSGYTPYKPTSKDGFLAQLLERRTSKAVDPVILIKYHYALIFGGNINVPHVYSPTPCEGKGLRATGVHVAIRKRRGAIIRYLATTWTRQAKPGVLFLATDQTHNIDNLLYRKRTQARPLQRRVLPCASSLPNESRLPSFAPNVGRKKNFHVSSHRCPM